MSNAIALRPARDDDLDQVFKWRNDPFIYSRAANPRPVNRREHAEWFRSAILSLDRLIYIIEHDGIAAGLLRFDRNPERSCVVSIYFEERFTGKGLGVKALKSGTATVFSKWDVTKILAKVRVDNHAGRAVFEKAGFAAGIQETENGVAFIWFSLSKS